MRSSHADRFNHDEDALGYDDDVRNETDPLRAGYEAVLDWVARNSNVASGSRVLELGSGTGNLTRRIPDCREIVCVDVSDQMEALSVEKVARFSNRRFIKDDVLAVFERDLGRFDSIVSTYTLHHLTEAEKALLFETLWASLSDNGIAVVGDLMVKDAKDLRTKVQKYRSTGYARVADALEEEFFWWLDASIRELASIGFKVEWKQFSDLSYGIVAKK